MRTSHLGRLCAELDRRSCRALWQARHPQPEEAPQRPALSPMLPALACAWGGVSLSVAAGTAASFGELWLGISPTPLFAFACLVATLIGLALSWRIPRVRTFVALALSGLLGGALAGGMFISMTFAAGERLQQAPVSACAFIVESDPKLGSTGNLTFEASAITSDADNATPGGSSTPSVGTRVWVSLSGSAIPEGPLRMGEVVRIIGSWDPLEADEWGRSLLARGCTASVEGKRYTVKGTQGGPIGAIRQFRARMLTSVDPTASPQRALIAGVVLGEQASLSGYPVSQDFANLGLTHLVAVSGSHLAVIAGIMGVALGGLRLRPGARLATSGLILGVYVILSGLQPSALRSLAMVMTAQGATLAGRRGHSMSALGAVALAMLLVDPANAGRMGFTLSVLSVLGIAAFSSLVGHWLQALTHPIHLPAGARDALALTLVSQTLTMPVTLPVFGVLPVLSPLANVLAAPVMSALLLVGLICVPLAWALPALAPVLLAPCDALAGVACGLAGALAQVPYAALPCEMPAVPCALVVATLALGAYAAWPLPCPSAARLVAAVPLAIVGTLFVSWRLLAPAHIVMLDVGQGDAILIQQGPSAMLVDTGPGDAVLSALARKHVLHLDAVLLTHTDSDHAGGLSSLDGLVGVDEIIVAEGVVEYARASNPSLAQTFAEAVGKQVREVSAGDVVRVGTFELEVVSPQGPVAGEDNPDSIVAVARFEPTGSLADDRTLSVLLTGDAEQELTGPLAQAGTFGDVDVLKVGHHGSAVSTSQELLAGCAPEIAVVSAGANNRYGHPAQACRDELATAGVPLLCTIEAGDIELRPGADGAEVRCQHPSALDDALSAGPQSCG